MIPKTKRNLYHFKRSFKKIKNVFFLIRNFGIANIVEKRLRQ